MFSGMDAFIFVHTVISLAAILAGVVVVYGLLVSKSLENWMILYFVLIGATSLTGFGLPADRLLPSHVVGIISLLLLVVVLVARYGFRLVGAWRWAFVGGIVSTLWFDVFVAIVQAFQKVPALHALAPTQSEPPFAIVQIATLVGFIAIGIAAGFRFRRAAMA